MGFLAWLRGGRSGASAGPMLGVFDEVFNPAAHRARQELEHQNERVIATPSPGDRLLDTGILEVRPNPKDGTAP
jgi:hypothetical protein